MFSVFSSVTVKARDGLSLTVTTIEVKAEVEKMAKAYGMEADKLKELLGERELEQMKKDMAVQEAVTLITEAAVEVEKTEE